MIANRVSAGEGVRWLGEGLRILRAAPVQQLLLHLAFLFLVAFTMSIPAVGFAAFWLLAPAFLVGPHALARAAGRGAPTEFTLLFEGFRNAFPGLLVLGGVFLAALLAALGATTFADDGRLFRAMVGIERLKIDDLFQPELHRALLLWAALETAVLGLLWYAPLLVAWHRVAAIKSAFFSAAATILNWRAMLVFSGVLVLALIALSMLALAAATLIARSEAARLSTAAFTTTWIFLPILFAASYRSYAAIFGEASRGDTGTEAD